MDSTVDREKRKEKEEIEPGVGEGNEAEKNCFARKGGKKRSVMRNKAIFCRLILRITQNNLAC